MLKVIDKKRLHSKCELKAVKRECAIQSRLEHKNICKLFAYTETDDSFVLIVEKVNNATFLKDIIEQHSIVEDEAKLKVFMNQIL